MQIKTSVSHLCSNEGVEHIPRKASGGADECAQARVSVVSVIFFFFKEEI